MRCPWTPLRQRDVPRDVERGEDARDRHGDRCAAAARAMVRLFLGRRLVWALITLFIFLTAVFFFMQVWVPYSWATQFLVGGGDAYEAAMEAAGLNRPLPERYVDYMLGLVARRPRARRSAVSRSSTSSANALPVTLTVFIAGAVIGWVVGELLGRIGTWSKRHPATARHSPCSASCPRRSFRRSSSSCSCAWLRDPLLDLREALGLPSDSLELWRGAVTGEPGALDPRRRALAHRPRPRGGAGGRPRRPRLRTPAPAAMGRGAGAAGRVPRRRRRDLVSATSVPTPSTCSTGSTSGARRGAARRPSPCSASSSSRSGRSCW